MKLYKLLLFLLLLGFSIEMPAQISLLDKIKCDTSLDTHFYKRFGTVSISLYFV